jgi:hypothetical protein
MQKRIAIASLLCLLFISSAIAPCFAETWWNKEYSIQDFNQAHCVIQTADKGYILAGFANTSSNGFCQNNQN